MGTAQLEQARILLEDFGVIPTEVHVDLGYRCIDKGSAEIDVIHRSTLKSITREQTRQLRHRQAVEPTIGHLRQDHRVERCWLCAAIGDALHALRAVTPCSVRPARTCAG